MNDLKSISEIAAALGVTRQAVYKKIKSNPELSTRLQEFTVNRGKILKHMKKRALRLMDMFAMLPMKMQ